MDNTSLNLTNRSGLDGRGRSKQQGPTTGFQVGSTSTSTSTSSQSQSQGPSQSQSQRKPPKPKMYNRTLSSNKLNKMSNMSSNRPNLGRSKSTDGLVKTGKRNNRSYTKLLSLLPLTRTTSNPGIKTVQSNGSLKGLNLQQPQIGLKSSGRKGRAILRFNDDIDNDDYEDMDDSISEHVLTEGSYSASKRPASLQEQVNRIIDHPTEPEPSSIPPANYQDSTDHSLIHKSNHQDSADLTLQQVDLTNSHQTETEKSSQFSKSSNNLNNNDNHNNSTNRTNTEAYSMTRNGNKSDTESASVISNSNRSSSANENADAYENPHGKDSQQVRKESAISSTIGKLDKDSTTDQQNNETGLNQSLADDLMSSNMYGGSLLLSQSTGLTKKIDPKLQYSTVNSVSIPKIQASMDSEHSESISGISFKANRYDQQQIAEPITTSKNVIPNNSYQTNQTIFNNLQRTGNTYLPSKTKPVNNTSNNNNNSNDSTNLSNSISSNNVYNFSNFLNTSKEQAHAPSQNIETRTQQRLWLQRENSLMDVANVDSNNFSSLSLNNLMFAHNQSRTNMRDYFSSKSGSGLNALTPGNQLSQIPKQNNSVSSMNVSNNANNINGLLTMAQNGGQSSIQSRTEFERTNREYLNVRRYLNPIGESLHRLEKLHSKDLIYSKPRKKDNQNQQSNTSLKSNYHSGNGNSFKDFSQLYQEGEQEGQALLQKLWHEAILTTQIPSPTPTPKLDVSDTTDSSSSSQTSVPKPQSTNLRAVTNQNSMNNLRSPRSQVPTTRAVKFAQSGGTQYVNTQKKELHI